MEPIGFTVGVVGLAGLFSVCLDVVDKVDSYKEFGVESRSIISQFEADKHLLTQWAQDVGIDKIKVNSNYYNQLDNPKTNLIVQKILSSIQEIFGKTEGTRSNLQPVMEAGPTSFPDDVYFLNTRKTSQNLKGAISKRDRIGWSLRSKAKFTYQVQQFGALVQRLYSLVPPDRLTGRINVQKGIIGNDPTSNDKAMFLPNYQRLLFQMEKQIEDETRKELDIWLGASWTNDFYDNFIRRRLDGTCDWILNRQAFSDWISSDFPSGAAKILWINGPAGYGKTVLCASIVRHLSTLESPCAYYFCSSEATGQRDPSIIMRSWISQMVSQSQDSFELACCKWEADHGRNASQTDIVKLFKALVHHIPNCTFIVDGLDECVWAEEKWRSSDDSSPVGFFQSIKQAVFCTATRVLILSRDEPEIRYSLHKVLAGNNHQGLTEYQIRPDDVRSDIILFSRCIVDKELANKNETLKNELSQRIVERCKGMFLWVKMLEEQLRRGKNKKQLEEAIDQTPTALDHLYDRKWAKISNLQDKDKHRAFSILRWAAFALRPLTILEITEALLIVDDDNCEVLPADELPDTIDEDYISSEILGLCGSFLETQKAIPTQELSSMTIHLAHFSVKQYILCNMASPELLMVNERLRVSSEAFQNNVLAKLCLRYLNLRNTWQESLQLQSGPVKRPFRDYAAGSWYHHTRESGSNYAEVVKLINALFSSNNENLESWEKWFDTNDDQSNIPKSRREITSTNPLFYASLLGLRDTVIYLLKEAKFGVNHVDGFSRTALQGAALNGQSLTVKLLLEKGADITIANKEGWTPLILASDSGHVEVVKLLLENGAEVAVASKEGWAPLKTASRNGHVEVVKLLLKQGANIEVTANNGGTPLHSASNSGHVEVVKLLLKNGADLTAANINGITPLIFACFNGYVEVVKVLLEYGADIEVADTDGWTPLHAASAGGSVDSVKVLLEQGADITVIDTDRWTPLDLACFDGYIEVVKVLLENGANLVEATSKQGWTPLTLASGNGHVEVVRLLLEKGADIAVKDKCGWEALHLACAEGHAQVVELLLNKSADKTFIYSNGVTMLNFASGHGHIEVVKLLLRIGADMTVASDEGWTPLHSASRNGHAEVVKLLLKDGADMSVTNIKGITPLNSACYNGHVEVVKVLLENGADITVANTGGWTPLHAASTRGHVDLVKLLLEQGADRTVTDDSSLTPLLLACFDGQVEVVKLLLEKGSDIAVANKDGWTPLNLASGSGHAEVVKLPLESGADVTVARNSEFTPLSMAARDGHEAVVRLLLEKGAEIESKDSKDRTPLWLAARDGHEAVVRLLLEKGAETEAKDRDSDGTPLSWAATNGHEVVVQLLLEKGAEIEAKDRQTGRTPLSWAARDGHEAVVRLLLEKGAEIESKDSKDRTPLWLAARDGHEAVVRLLLEKGAETEAKDRDSDGTPLSWAATNGHEAVVQLLLEKGAEIEAKDRQTGRTPLSWAVRNGHRAVAKILLDRGAVSQEGI